VLTLNAISRDVLGWGGALILSSGFLIDSIATLLTRMCRTRHWHQGHRSHLYQWLWRRGWREWRINIAWQSWNLLVVAPVMLGLQIMQPDQTMELVIVGLVFALGYLIWRNARHALHRMHRAQYRP
jgi:hypothetical protein